MRNQDSNRMGLEPSTGKSTPWRRLAGAVRVGTAIALLATSGCALFHRDNPMVENYGPIGFDELWVTSLSVIGREFPLRTTDKKAGTFVTEWRTNLHAFRYEGKRRRIEGKIRDEGEEGCEVEIVLRVEKNTEIDRPLDARYATWRREPDDTSGARRLLHLIGIAVDDSRKRSGSGT